MKKFEYIYGDIRKKIEDGHFKIGSFLPKENDLAKEYGVSRETLRKAQVLLQDDGLIRKIHGRGAKVLDFSKFEIGAHGITSFTDLVNRHKGSLETKVLKHKIEYLDEVAFGYDQSEHKPVVAIERVRVLNDEAVILDKDYYLLDTIGGDIPESELQSSIFTYLEQMRGLKIGFAQKDITIEPVTPEIQLTLDVKTDTHVVVTRSLVYLENTQLFQIHEAYQRVDTFRLSDIARR